ncbi:MAG: membrane protein insertion efficiency factor YidD [Ruminococcus sp.]|nr:membrane protein insertion efficiency factor YidD [Ruminococcus sp.]
MKRILIGSIRFYQKNISVRTTAKCKYYPTCSHYAVEAIQTHGALKGFFLSIWRILRCNPFSKGGFDPVPEKRIRGKKER